METDWNIASNKELQDERDRLDKAYREIQEEIMAKVDEMSSLSEQYQKIMDILNKRNAV